MLTAILDKSHQRNLHRSVMNACKSPDCGRKRARKRQTKRQKERERERLFGACFCVINTCNDMHTCCLTANFVYIWFLSTTLHFSFLAGDVMCVQWTCSRQRKNQAFYLLLKLNYLQKDQLEAYVFTKLMDENTNRQAWSMKNDC